MRNKQSVPDGALDMNIAGGDIMFLAIFGFIYLVSVFVIERMRNVGSIYKFFTKETKVPYQAKE